MARKAKDPNKASTIFEHLDHISAKKRPWNDLREIDQKSFTPYLINRWLSMNPDLIEIVNLFQKHTIGGLGRKEVYELYSGFLPQMKLPFNKYVKGKKGTKHNPELVKFLAEHFLVSKAVMSEYLDIMYMQENGKIQVEDILRAYGYNDKEIKKLLKPAK